MTSPDVSLSSPLRLRLDGAALVANWQWLNQQSGAAACGAAIKADGYGLGAIEVARRLRAAGCRDFYVATWAEALALHEAGQGDGVAVLHGVRADDLVTALALPDIRPVLNTPAQVQQWRMAAGSQPCDIMVDTGMNRLGLSLADIGGGIASGLTIDTVMSHLASADEDSPLNAEQLALFRSLQATIPARRYSLANSAGICLGADYAFDLTRPGLALYGGVPRKEAAGHIRQTVFPEAQVLQCRSVPAGATVGYNGTWRASDDCTIAIINLGYADGYLRSFSDRGVARFDDTSLPVIGRVSMDLVALLVPEGCALKEGDWVTIDYVLDHAAMQSGLSPYELLTSLGRRYDRYWV